jgi:hypothetical protein
LLAETNIKKTCCVPFGWHASQSDIVEGNVEGVFSAMSIVKIR